MNRYAPALDVANAVLYEGYLLFPYTASAGKNRIRWQFGVVVPDEYTKAGTGELAEFRSEFFFRPEGDAPPAIELLVRFLQVEARRVEAYRDGAYEPVESLVAGDRKLLTFDEGIEREWRAHVALTDGLQYSTPVAFADGRDVEDVRDAAGNVTGRVIRERWPLHGALSVDVRSARDVPGLLRVGVALANHSSVVAGERSSALRTAFVSTHLLAAAENGSFVSTQDAPPELASESSGLAARGLYAVLAGEKRADERYGGLLFASPIILYDYPETAKNTTDHYDATEVDELLTLSVRALSDAERDEAKQTDPRARAIVERAEALDATALGRVHAGALYRLDGDTNERYRAADPFAELDVPSFDCVFVDGVKVSKGASVRLSPKRRADIWDTALRGKTATVRAIHQDVENQLYVAVTVDDDPASDLHEWYGRSFFFYPEEIEPLAPAPARSPSPFDSAHSALRSG